MTQLKQESVNMIIFEIFSRSFVHFRYGYFYKNTCNYGQPCCVGSQAERSQEKVKEVVGSEPGRIGRGSGNGRNELDDGG